VASPASVAAGVASSVTVQLNHALTSGSLSLLLVSSDTSVVRSPQTVLIFNAGDVTKLISLPTRTPQAQPKTVTITTTGSRNTSLGPVAITGSTTLTVTP
jgi:hypothetical protein